MVALEKKEEEIKERPPNLKPKPSTPIRTKIRRFEEKAYSPGVSRTSRSIKKSRPEPKVQSIRKFFMSPLKKTGDTQDGPLEIIRTPRNKKPIRLGALSKPKVARSSGPPKEIIGILQNI